MTVPAPASVLPSAPMRRVVLFACLTALAGCASGPAGPSSITDCPALSVFVAASDYTSSGVGFLPFDGSPASLGYGPDLGGDPALASSAAGGSTRVFFINRTTAAIFEIGGNPCGKGTRRFSGVQAGESQPVDPQDVAVAPDGSLWIARFGTASQLVLEPSGAPRATVDLGFVDADGNPNAGSVRIATSQGASKAFFTLGMLDDNSPSKASTRPSLMAIVDVATRQVEGTVTLAGRNPFGLMNEQGGDFYLAEPGSFAADHESDAGIERFSPATRTTAMLLRESQLGGSVVQVAVGSGGCGAAILADATPQVNRTVLVTFSASSGQTTQTFASPSYGPTPGFDLQGLAWQDDRLLVGDRRKVPDGYAVHTFLRGDNCLLAPDRDLFLPLPPVAFAAR